MSGKCFQSTPAVLKVSTRCFRYPTLHNVSPVRWQAITWRNNDLFSIGPLRTKTWKLECVYNIFTKNAFENIVYKMWACCLGFNVLTVQYRALMSVYTNEKTSVIGNSNIFPILAARFAVRLILCCFKEGDFYMVIIWNPQCLHTNRTYRAWGRWASAALIKLWAGNCML